MNRAPTQGSPCGERRTRWQSRPYLRQRQDSKGAPWGNREGCYGHEIILGSQVSATGYLVQVFRFGYRSRA